MDNMKRNIILIFLLVIMLPQVLSETELGTFKQNQGITLYQLCSNCSYVNITSIKYPNGTIETIGLHMTKNGEDYTYSFNKAFYIGEYQYTVCGDKEGEPKCEVIKFDVTPSGLLGTLGFYILILVLSIGIIILGFSKEDPIIVILGSFGLYFVGLYILFFGIDGVKDQVYTWAIGIITLMLAAYISLRSSWELIVD